ncbi:battenin-like isoform X2 [Rhodnius prolixus]|uniref:Battenin n=3 Tax=Rhodnius TaxID=13248 RepID=A0A0P4VRA7_9HEMI
MEEKSQQGIANSRVPVRPRSLVAFWFLGLCNNYGYVVMLAAAIDILSTNFHYTDGDTSSNSSSNATYVRQCTHMSTGAILLADIIPSLTIKLISPFFPLFIHFRMALIVILSAAGYILVAEAPTVAVAIAGVVCTALSSGLGEASLLSYMAFYKNKHIISTWSSGTGAAGFFGSFTYAILTKILGSHKITLYVLLTVPAVMGMSFWFLLEPPKRSDGNSNGSNKGNGTTGDLSKVSSSRSSEIDSEVAPIIGKSTSLSYKFSLIPSLFKYMIPLFLVYLFEYFINQGLFELITFDISWLTHAEQYKWYQVDYQVGVFISRSSINLIQINKTWILALCQFISVIFFATEAIFTYLPSIYIVFLAVLCEGFFGGAAYVNTFNRINQEVPDDRREFSMGMTSLADAVGISLAGFLAIPAHDAICNLPPYK